MSGHCSSHSLGSHLHWDWSVHGVMSGTPMAEGRQMQTHLE